MFSNPYSKGDLPRWCNVKKSACQCRRCEKCGLNLWAEKISWSRKWYPTPVSLPGKFYGQMSLVGYSFMGPQRVRHSWAPMRRHTHTHTHTHTHAHTYIPKEQLKFNCLGRYRMLNFSCMLNLQRMLILIWIHQCPTVQFGSRCRSSFFFFFFFLMPYFLILLLGDSP